MEYHKRSYTHSLLSRVLKSNQLADATIKDITDKILEKAALALSCYAATHELNDDVRNTKNNLKNGDPILGNDLVLLEVRDDLLLLENQIPMFVLQKLFEFRLLCGRTSFEIPKLCLYDSTEPFLRNLIAFEQCSPSIPLHITSYAFLMDTLINTKKDVKVLEEAGVLENYLGASEDATRLFNTICKEVVLGEFTFGKQWLEVEKYRKSEWPSHVASLRRDYFSSPWALISVIAALILFALAVVQTVYTIRAYIKGWRSVSMEGIIGCLEIHSNQIGGDFKRLQERFGRLYGEDAILIVLTQSHKLEVEAQCSCDWSSPSASPRNNSFSSPWMLISAKVAIVLFALAM
ncbi:hypothetical protein RJ640_018370 [Escallonia rubra]|uniref:Uncharacterized protein n=1 Tax=Escallonia rubra TaxID=112253 RepID=A0AA88UVA9_9ASTE|nr:hypothetical protein RJ640_018370 [Escallonia rubra]